MWMRNDGTTWMNMGAASRSSGGWPSRQVAAEGQYLFLISGGQVRERSP